MPPTAGLEHGGDQYHIRAGVYQMAQRLVKREHESGLAVGAHVEPVESNV